MQELSIFEKLGLCTIRIECELDNGATSTGTGFFVKFGENENNFIPAIITNKHVVRDSNKGTLFFTLSDDNAPAYGKNHRFNISDFESAWRMHPDPEIDLCALPIHVLVKAMNNNALKPWIEFLDTSLIPTETDIDEMAGMEKVVMVGYPNGLWDAKHNQPIFRSGILASHYKFDWNGKSEFVIDAACFPGSSGSPVLIIDIGQVYTKKGTNIGSSRVKFLGILYAGPMMTTDGKIEIQPTPTNTGITAKTNIPINLGYVIKSSNLYDLEKMLETETKS